MAKKNRHALILAGGRGTRFWPRSRTKSPKQLLPFLGENSLLQETIDRLRPALPPGHIWILTSEELRDAVRKQLPDVPADQILAEPAQRNTAPCLGLAAQIIHSIDPDAVLGIFPADHHIEKPARFRQLLGPAFAAAERGKLATIGIEPRWPETGYGYLQFPKGTGAGSMASFPLKRFREKPDLKTAKKFVAAGNFFWNAGMFFWRADQFLNAMRQYMPKTAAVLASLPDFKDKHFSARLNKTYPLCENISVDFGIMEKAAADNKVEGVPAGDIGWNDLGSWNAVYELLPRDASGNAGGSQVLHHESTGCYVEAGGKLVAVVGLSDLIIVDTPDALLIVHRDQAQRVGEVVKLLERHGHHHLL
jgi:mannose-1-phosphate guanylyltransferase